MASLSKKLLGLLDKHLAWADSPGKGKYQTIDLAGLKIVAEEFGISLLESMRWSLAQNIWPLRFCRNRGLFSSSEQAELLSRHAAIIGCGGLGSFQSITLARLGLGKITLCDYDSFSESNLNRQVLCRENNLGQNKALVTQAEINSIASHVVVRAFDYAATAENLPCILGGVNIVMDALDNLQSRQELATAAHNKGIPYIYGSLAGLEGFAGILLPASSSSTKLLATSGQEGAQAEKDLGVPTPTPPAVAVLQCLMAANTLLKREKKQSTLLHLDLTVPEIEIFLL